MRVNQISIATAMVAALLWLGVQETSQAGDYDPLKLASDAEIETLELVVKDTEREREIPLLVYLPPAAAAQSPAPLLLFSHGLGGTRHGSAFLGKHWAARGYMVAFLQHAGSDDAVWRDSGIGQRMGAMQKAASLGNLLLRLEDVPAAIDQLGAWSKESGHALQGKLDAENVGMSGHSFGARTTQAVSGESMPLVGTRYTDPRIKAALPMSPSVPSRNANIDENAVKRTFADVKIPWLLMTGTNDTAPIGNQTVEMRLAVFPGLPAGDKYELVLFEAEHSAFTERALPGENGARNPNHHRVILALSTAFWDTYLRGNADAKAWLQGYGPKGVLETEDSWKLK